MGLPLCILLYRVILGISRTPQDFRHDILLPNPKRGDACLCSNYHTIALQNMTGKPMPACCVRPAPSLQMRLWTKTGLSLDLAKAVDSVDREVARQILLIWGAPPKLVALNRDLHTHHSPVIRSKVDSASVGTSVGFKQGCVLAQPLFNVCLESVICQLQLQQICYKINGQLMHCKHLRC